MLQFITVGNGAAARKIAVEVSPGASNPAPGLPGVLWLGGYRSDMSGTKALALAHWCAANRLACARLDYSGHGRSGGSFEDGSISRWLEESLAVFGAFTAGPQILAGSSMGGWIALRMAQELHKRGQTLHAMLLIAPAPDFTEALILPSLSDQQKLAIERDGRLEQPSSYASQPDVCTREFFADGRRNLVLNANLRTHCPVHILQGRLDADVPWTHAMALAQQLSADEVSMTLVPDGDHRLSRPQDIALMLRCLAQLAGL